MPFPFDDLRLSPRQEASSLTDAAPTDAKRLRSLEDVGGQAGSHSAVDDKLRARAVARLIGCEKEDQVSDVLRRTQAPEWHRPGEQASIVGDFKQAWEARDIGALIGMLDPDVTLTSRWSSRFSHRGTALLIHLHRSP